MAVSRIEERWRLPGCGPACVQIVALVMGEGRKSQIELHDPEAHEAYASQGQTGAIVTGPLVIDFSLCAVRVDGVRVRLSETEWRVLAHLARRVGEVYPHRDLIRDVWGAGYGENTVRSLMSRLRQRLGAAGQMIDTRTFVGYFLRSLPVCRAEDIPPSDREEDEAEAAGRPAPPPGALPPLQQTIYDALEAAGPSGLDWRLFLVRTVGSTVRGRAGTASAAICRLRTRGATIVTSRATLERPAWVAMTAGIDGVKTP